MYFNPVFMLSSFFDESGKFDPETEVNWRLKPGAPPEVQKEFDQWREYAIKHKLSEGYFWL